MRENTPCDGVAKEVGSSRDPQQVYVSCYNLPDYRPWEQICFIVEFHGVS